MHPSRVCTPHLKWVSAVWNFLLVWGSQVILGNLAPSNALWAQFAQATWHLCTAKIQRHLVALPKMVIFGSSWRLRRCKGPPWDSEAQSEWSLTHPKALRTALEGCAVQPSLARPCSKPALCWLSLEWHLRNLVWVLWSALLSPLNRVVNYSSSLTCSNFSGILYLSV